ncbi:small acid-soluble spore protein SspI [Paenibacillus daejeonensis]|uniref:small acid-soluble spore protein SspI n=1 Tax=Paenibacillus daejeonensis TaxID=135193 RepID=UPI00036CBF8C|nr:small acid-soluble spore protein SspI [Paenibacillus daejeonensis]
MNDINLRQAIIQRVYDKSNEDLVEVIESSVGSDERALPGLGVLFEMIWLESEQPQRQAMVENLHTKIQKQTPAGAE